MFLPVLFYTLSVVCFKVTFFDPLPPFFIFFFTEIMNLQEYFAKIGFQGSNAKPDLATLRQIHRQHVMVIPFENLSIHCGERITLDLQVIFDKEVRSNRGGCCLENNCLFNWVLREMGYDVTMLGARVFDTDTNDFTATEDHLINKVVIDGRAYIADVSFGMSSQILEPLELISGKEQPQPVAVFRLVEEGETWVLEKTSRKKVTAAEFSDSPLIDKKPSGKIYCFSLAPRQVDHFLEFNHSLQTDPDSLFTNKSICSLQTPTGFRGLVGLSYSQVTFKPEEGVDLIDMQDIPEEEVERILWEKFGVKLQNKLKPVNQKASFTL